MKKIFLFIAIPFFSGTTLFAQTLSDAIKQTTNEQFETADATFKSVLQTSPNNGDIYFYYGENYFKNDNLELANKMYQKGVELNATNPLCYVGLGKVQWYKGKRAEAKANFFKATTLAKTFQYAPYVNMTVGITIGKNSSVTKAKYQLNSEGTVLMKIAEAYINSDNKDITEALNLLTQALKSEPFNPEIYITTGDAYMEHNDGTKAVEYYEKAATLDPKSVKSILRQGQLYNRSRNYPLALDFYKKALLVDSSFAPAYREMAEIYFRAGQYNKASEQYKHYLKLNNDCGARGRYAGFLNQAKQFAESIEAAKEALKCDSNNVYLHRYLAYDYCDLQPTPDYVLGLENSNLFFAKADTNVKIIQQDYEYHAKLLSKNGKDSLAIIDYETLLKKDTSNIDLYSDIASSYFKMKNYAKAIAFYNKKVELKKANINDYFGLGRAFYFSKDFINADSAFSQIIKVQPDLGIGYLWKAKSNSQLDPKNEKWLAKPFYEQYLTKIKPEDSEKNKKDLIDASTYLGVYYMNNKDFKTAKTYFQKVLELDPKNSNGLKFMASPEAKKVN